MKHGLLLFGQRGPPAVVKAGRLEARVVLLTEVQHALTAPIDEQTERRIHHHVLRRVAKNFIVVAETLLRLLFIRGYYAASLFPSQDLDAYWCVGLFGLARGAVVMVVGMEDHVWLSLLLESFVLK